MKPRKQFVDKQYTRLYALYSFFILSLVFYVLVTFIGNVVVQNCTDSSLGIFAVIAAGMATTYMLYDYYHDQRSLGQRTVTIQKLAAQYRWQLVPELINNFVSSASVLQLATESYEFQNHIIAGDWEYTDLSYGVYRSTKFGTIHAQSVYYGIMQMTLPRALPNVLFDSKKHRGRQFEIVFDKHQLHRLEGGFDNYFNTYFAQDYTLDSMSFITPEVMQALIDADEYDIEIVDNKLILYGPVYEAENQLLDMQQKLGAIKQKLLNNVVTYRDERLPYELGRQRVAPLGMRLRRRKQTIWLSVLAVIIYIIYYIFYT